MGQYLSTEDGLAILTMERREEGRQRCEPPCLIHVMGRPELKRIPAYVWDFSARGIGFVTERPFEANTLLAVQLQHRQVGLSGMLSATVCHRHQLPSGKWFHGCKLSRSLTDEEQSGLLVDRQS